MIWRLSKHLLTNPSITARNSQGRSLTASQLLKVHLKARPQPVSRGSCTALRRDHGVREAESREAKKTPPPSCSQLCWAWLLQCFLRRGIGSRSLPILLVQNQQVLKMAKATHAVHEGRQRSRPRTWQGGASAAPAYTATRTDQPQWWLALDEFHEALHEAALAERPNFIDTAFSQEIMNLTMMAGPPRRSSWHV